jgi:hypothetical protein
MKEEHDQADTMLNETCFDLIFGHAYGIAETLLRFGTKVIQTHGGSDGTRRRMLVNLANSIRLQDRIAEANQLIDKEDWSSSSDIYKMCKDAVKSDINSVINYMKKLGSNGDMNAEAYRTWPVFWSIKTNEQFLETFEAIFSEPFISPSAVNICPEPEVRGGPESGQGIG